MCINVWFPYRPYDLRHYKYGAVTHWILYLWSPSTRRHVVGQGVLGMWSKWTFQIQQYTWTTMNHINVAYDPFPYNMASTALTIECSSKWRHCHPMYTCMNLYWLVDWLIDCALLRHFLFNVKTVDGHANQTIQTNSIGLNDVIHCLAVMQWTIYSPRQRHAAPNMFSNL